MQTENGDRMKRVLLRVGSYLGVPKYRNEDFLARVREPTGGEGVDVALDGFGGALRLVLPELEDVSELDELVNHGPLALKLSADARAVRLWAPDERADQHRPQGLAAQQLGTARHGSIDAPMLNAPQVQHGELGERIRQGVIAATTMVRRIGRPEEVAAALRFSPATTLLGTTQARSSPSRGWSRA